MVIRTDQQAIGLSESAPIVDLGYAKYQGALNITSNVTTFLGIRYAAAPVGDTL
jgi:carboxylesterase type B